ncbi:hypothetical protein ABZZ17_18250 [Streptomyces sp. NPDC006512]|uniref:hypothetical protein n=1 Tax=Streptomyces sp. NPDC006512 TaxID=3154307 RepID=UPI0033A699E9
MRNRTTLAAALATGVLTLALTATTTAATAAGNTGASGGRADREATPCGAVRLTGELPAPPAGMAVRQQVTIGEDCRPVLGEVTLVPARESAAAKSAAAPATGAAAATAAGATRQFKSWNEMFDCCNIRMTGLYTTSQWTSDGNRVTAASTEVTQQWNREPWNAGWSLKSAAKNTDCATDCDVSRTEAHADFTYKGIFDPSGGWYANTHHSAVDLKADGTATCSFDVSLRHTFIGWNWQRGCQ